MGRDDWAPLLNAVGAAGAAVGLVYAIGGVVLSLRYEGFGLSGQEAAAVTPREILLFTGARSLAIWTLLGIALVLTVNFLSGDLKEAVRTRWRKRRNLLILSVAVVPLLLVLRVWWPLAALLAVLGIMVVTASLAERAVARFLLTAALIALVALAYEADRLTYQLDWTCVSRTPTSAAAGADGNRSRPRGRTDTGGVCGIQVGHNDRGFFIGRPGAGSRSLRARERYRLVFIPTALVAQASIRKQKATVVENHADARRRTLGSRLTHIEVR